MSNPNLVPKPITDKNGKSTTVLVNPDKGVSDATVARVSGASTPVAAAQVAEDTETRAILDAAIEKVKASNGYELTYVDYRSSLADNKEGMNAFLSGDGDALNEHVFEGWDDGDNRYEGVKMAANDVLREHGYDWDDLEPDEQDELREAIEEKDTSDPLKDLLRNTPAQLVKYDIDNAYEAVNEFCKDANGEVDTDKFYNMMDGSNDNFDDRVAFVTDYLDKLGFETTTDDAKAAVNSLVANGNYNWHEGVQMGFTFRTDIDDVHVGEYFDGEEHTERDITFTEPVNFGMIDRWNGSGFVEEFTPKRGGVTFTATKEKPVELDGTGGYGWDNIVGGTYGMNANVKSEWKKPTPA